MVYNPTPQYLDRHRRLAIPAMRSVTVNCGNIAGAVYTSADTLHPNHVTPDHVCNYTPPTRGIGAHLCSEGYRESKITTTARSTLIASRTTRPLLATRTSVLPRFAAALRRSRPSHPLRHSLAPRKHYLTARPLLSSWRIPRIFQPYCRLSLLQRH